MPTFLFFKNSAKVDEMKGANPGGLTQKVEVCNGLPHNESEIVLIPDYSNCKARLMLLVCRELQLDTLI